MQLFINYQGAYGDTWESIQIPRIQAIQQGMRVRSRPIPYQHPIEQTAQEAGQLDYLRKRITQLHNIVPALCKEWSSKIVNPEAGVTHSRG